MVSDLYVRKSTAWWAAGMVFLVGVFLGLEVMGYVSHQHDPKPVFVRIPPQPQPVDVIESMGCAEKASKAYHQCKAAKVKKG